MPMAHFLAFKAGTARASGLAGLRVPLDEWKYLTVEFGGKSVTFSAAEIFKALQGVK